ncbi:unnamed protein product [Candidula unifasciata]|uniref:Large ribosomal subunit protein mL62 n=1 Tax=Candidula unifasciata TaxID=100452 RepID=A0A8S3YR14_9EUPU|nr:unnamed protein product [Candidula unifasciata]
MFRRQSALILRQFNSVISDVCSPKIQTACFKSHTSIDKIYPNSNLDYLRKPEQVQDSFAKTGSPDAPEKFTGYIPIEQLEVTATRSSGPGGQSVNTVNSKVEIRFHLESASWIPDWIKPRIIEKAEGKLTKDGYLVLRSDMTRKQILNQADCMNKLRNLIFAASTLPKPPTQQEIKVKEERLAKAKAGVLREKKDRALLKQFRTSPESF